MNLLTKLTISLIIFLSVYINISQAKNQNSIDSLKNAFEELNLPQVQLNFSEQISNQLNNLIIPQEHKKLNNVLKLANNVQALKFCDTINYEKIKFDLELHQLRLELLNSINDFEYSGSIYDLINHK